MDLTYRALRQRHLDQLVRERGRELSHAEQQAAELGHAAALQSLASKSHLVPRAVPNRWSVFARAQFNAQVRQLSAVVERDVRGSLRGIIIEAIITAIVQAVVRMIVSWIIEQLQQQIRGLFGDGGQRMESELRRLATEAGNT